MDNFNVESDAYSNQCDSNENSNNYRLFPSQAVTSDTINKKEECIKNEMGEYSNDYNVNEKSLHYRFLIPQPVAGAIISRKGETIKRMRSQYNCDINVPPSTGPERLLLINADIDRLCAVLAEILELAKDCMHSKVNDPKDVINGIVPDNIISDEMDLRFLVSENVCGAIIGKGGEVIRRLTDTYRISVMKVYQQMCPASTDRVIRLVGYPDDILNCLRAINAVILGLKDVKSAREYDPNNYNEIHAVNYGGWMTPEARRNLSRHGGPPIATKGPTPSGLIQQDYATSSYGGKIARSAPVMQGLTLAQMEDKLRSQNIMMDVSHNVSAQGYQSIPRRTAPIAVGPIEMSHVSLPNKLIGAIMGKGGSRINEIRENSGARIDVEKTPIKPDSDERVITIQGTREQIETAQYLLQQCVRKYGTKEW